MLDYNEWTRRIREERLNDSGRACVDLASMIIVGAAKIGAGKNKQGRSERLEAFKEARAWLKLGVDFDRADVERRSAAARRTMDDKKRQAEAARTNVKLVKGAG